MENGLTREQIADVSNNDAFISMVNAILNYSKEKSIESRTAKLWLLYIEYTYIVKEFLVVKRTYNRYLHLQVLMKMINLFAASGHRNYAECSRLYLHEMLSLPYTNPCSATFKQILGKTLV